MVLGQRLALIRYYSTSYSLSAFFAPGFPIIALAYIRVGNLPSLALSVTISLAFP
jgi:hypothetical protein